MKTTDVMQDSRPAGADGRLPLPKQDLLSPVVGLNCILSLPAL